MRYERIIANTLIRIAIDGLLAHGERLRDDNETELRSSSLAFLRQRKAVQHSSTADASSASSGSIGNLGGWSSGPEQGEPLMLRQAAMPHCDSSRRSCPDMESPTL